jgi:ribosomal protein L37AE/L43A
MDLHEMYEAVMADKTENEIVDEIIDEIIAEDGGLHACPMCGFEQTATGKLGALLHFNCRHCGAWFSAEDK